MQVSHSRLLEEAFHELVRLSGGLWTHEERAIFDEKLSSKSGRGELSYRKRCGLELKAEFGTKDLPDQNEEVKQIDGSGGFGHITFAAEAAHARGDTSKARIKKMFSDQRLDEVCLDVLVDYEISAAKLNNFPDIKEALKLSKCSSVGSLVLVTKRGFYKLPRIDFDDACEIIRVTQSKPKYRLSLSWLEQELVRRRAQVQEELPVSVFVDEVGDTAVENFTILFEKGSS